MESIKSPYKGYSQSAQRCHLYIEKDWAQGCDDPEFVEFAASYGVELIEGATLWMLRGTFPALVKLLVDVWYYDDISDIQHLINRIVTGDE